MNRQSAALLLLLLALIFQSCNNERNREIFEDFEGEEGIYMIKVPPGLFLNLVNKETETDTENLGNIDFVKFLMFNEGGNSKRNSEDLLLELREKFEKYGYEVVIQFSNSETDISAYMLENEKHVTDLMIVFSENESVIGLGLSGKLDGKALMNFTSDIDFEDLKSISGGFNY